MKVAVSLQQIIWITKEIEVPDNYINNPTPIQIPVEPNDKPVVKNIIDIFDEDCNLIKSYGREQISIMM